MRILFLILFLPISAYAGMMSFSISPGVINFETVKGGIKTFDLSFLNQGEDPLNVDVEVMDLSLDVNGVPLLNKISKKNEQWARYVTLDENSFRVGAKQSKKVHVTLKTPRSGFGGGYFAVVFNTSALKSRNQRKKNKNVMVIGGQLPTLFIGEIPRIGTRKVKVVNGAINKAPYTKDKPFKLRFLLNNTGTTHVNVVGDVLLRYNKKVVGRLKLESGSGLILPKGRRYFVANWDQFDKHLNKNLKAEARFSYPGGRITKKLMFKIR